MLDFIKFCQEFNIPIDTNGNRDWVQTHCIFCNDNNWHLGYNLSQGNMNCWKCGPHNIYEFLSIILKTKNQSIRQILNLYQQNNITLPKKQIKTRPRKTKKPPHMESLSKIHRHYLKQKNFNPTKLTKEWNLKATKGLSGKWSWRIIAPILNKEWMVVGYTGRTLTPNTKPKWKHSKNENMSIDPKTLLYGIERTKNKILIVEGASDVWRMGPGAVGTFGINWKMEQAIILKTFSHRFIMFDPEKEAQKQAKKLANWLAPFPGETEIISGIDTDPGDLDQSEADNIMKELGFF